MKAIVLGVRLKEENYVLINGSNFYIMESVGFSIIGYSKSKKVKFIVDNYSLDEKKSLKLAQLLGCETMELFLNKNMKHFQTGANGWVSHMYLMSFVPVKELLSYL